MGTSQSTGELVDKFRKYAFLTGNANRQAVTSAALVYKNRLLATAARDTGGDRRLSRWRRRFGAGGDGQSPKLNAGFDVFGYDNAKAVIKPRPYGIWALLEGGAAPHRIYPFRYARGSRNQGARKALKFGGQFAAYVDHPGTPAKRTFSDALTAEPQAKRVFREAHRRGLLEVFGP